MTNVTGPSSTAIPAAKRLQSRPPPMAAADPVPRWVVVAGDLVLVVLFVLLGATMGHGEDPIAQAGRITLTATTFVVGWTLAALATGAYAPDWATDRRTAAGRTILGWLVGVAIALALRSTAAIPGSAAPSFFVVASLVGIALLVPWRIGLAWASDGVADS